MPRAPQSPSAPSLRDRLAPHLVDYDRMGVDWRPYIMFFNRAGYVSPALNTDRLGFRITHAADGSVIDLAATCSEPCQVLIGNSVAFGVGATSDRAALASRLGARCGLPTLNFCGRAHGGMQELLMFLSYRHLAPRLKTVVICSGLNDLYLYYTPKMFDETFGIFFFSEVFNRQMNQIGVSPPVLTWRRRLIRALLAPFYGQRIDYATVPLARLPGLMLHPPAPVAPRPLTNSDAAITDAVMRDILASHRPGRDRVLALHRRTLEHWRLLAAGLGIRLVYALQPMQPWSGRTSGEEIDLLREYDSVPGRWHTTTRHVLDADHHRWYADGLQAICDDLEIPFIDLNQGFAARGGDRWLFVDRVHMTDAGQELCAELLAEFLSGPNRFSSANGTQS